MFGEYRENGKENGNYYVITGYILGLVGNKGISFIGVIVIEGLCSLIPC